MKQKDEFAASPDWLGLQADVRTERAASRQLDDARQQLSDRMLRARDAGATYADLASFCRMPVSRVHQWVKKARARNGATV